MNRYEHESHLLLLHSCRPIRAALTSTAGICYFWPLARLECVYHSAPALSRPVFFTWQGKHLVMQKASSLKARRCFLLHAAPFWEIRTWCWVISSCAVVSLQKWEVDPSASVCFRALLPVFGQHLGGVNQLELLPMLFLCECAWIV